MFNLRLAGLMHILACMTIVGLSTAFTNGYEKKDDVTLLPSAFRLFAISRATRLNSMVSICGFRARRQPVQIIYDDGRFSLRDPAGCRTPSTLADVGKSAFDYIQPYSVSSRSVTEYSIASYDESAVLCRSLFSHGYVLSSPGKAPTRFLIVERVDRTTREVLGNESDCEDITEFARQRVTLKSVNLVSYVSLPDGVLTFSFGQDQTPTIVLRNISRVSEIAKGVFIVPSSELPSRFSQLSSGAQVSVLLKSIVNPRGFHA